MKNDLMKRIQILVQKSTESPHLVIFLFLTIGITVRLLSLPYLLSQEVLNSWLPGTDEFNYQSFAQHPSTSIIQLKMTLYPAYKYFIKGIFTLTHSLSIVPWVQVCLASIASIAFYFTARNSLSRSGALLAWVLFNFYQMNYLYDWTILPTSMSQSLLVFLLFFYSQSLKGASKISWLGLLITGLLLFYFRIFYTLFFLIFIFHIFQNRQKLKRLFYLLSLTLCLLVGAFTYTYFKTPESFSHKFGILFYIAHLDKSNGVLVELPSIPKTAKAHAVNGLVEAYRKTPKNQNHHQYWINQTIDLYKNQTFETLRFLGKRLFYLTNYYEIPCNQSYDLVSSKALPIKFPKIGFSLIFALGFYGLCKTLKNKRGPYSYTFPFFGSLIMVLGVFLCSRYRYPLIPFLCLFAGYSFPKKFYSKETFFYLVPLTTLFYSISILSNPPVNTQKQKQFWENRYLKQEQFLKEHKLLKKKLLSFHEDAIEVQAKHLLQAGKLHQYAFFFHHIDRVLASPKLSIKRKHRLLVMKGQLLEETFNFDLASQWWKKNFKNKGLDRLARRNIKRIEEIIKALARGYSPG